MERKRKSEEYYENGELNNEREFLGEEPKLKKTV